MTQHFDPEVVHAVLAHMNDDHKDDNLVIIRAFADPGATDVTMVGLDGDGSDWEYVDAEGETVPTRIPWPREVNERKDIRRAVVEMHRDALARLDAPSDS